MVIDAAVLKNTPR